jgi:hypothetical protein
VTAGAAVVSVPATFDSAPAAGVGSTAAVTGAVIVVATPPALVVTVSTAPDAEAATLLTTRSTVDGAVVTG